MDPRFRKLAVFAGAAVLAGGVGVAVASQGGDESASGAALTQGMPGQSGQGTMPDPSAGQSQDDRSGQDVPGQGGMPGQGATPGQDGMRGGPPGMGGGPGAIDLDTLAGELGVTTDDLEAALRTIRPERPTQSGANPLVAALADALDLSESKVAAALEALRPSGAPDGGATPPSGAAPGGTPPADDGTSTDTQPS